MTKSRSQQRCSLLDFYLWVKLVKSFYLSKPLNIIIPRPPRNSHHLYSE